MPSAPKSQTRWAGEILAALVKQKRTKQSEGTNPGLLEATLEIVRLLQVMVRNIDTLMEKQAVLEVDLPPAPTEAKFEVEDRLSAKAARLSKVATLRENTTSDDAACGARTTSDDAACGASSYMGPGESHANNCHWDIEGVRALMSASRTAIVGCNHVLIGRARMWISGQQELINGDLTPGNHAIIVNCKDVWVPEIHQVCQRREAAITVLDPMNIGYAPGRWERFEHALKMCIRAVNLGGDVFIHCKSGVHRAALVFALNLMFLQADTSFEDACKQLQEIRPQVKLHDIINPQLRTSQNSQNSQKTGHARFTEDMKPWIKDWEERSRTQQYYLQIQKTA